MQVIPVRLCLDTQAVSSFPADQSSVNVRPGFGLSLLGFGPAVAGTVRSRKLKQTFGSPDADLQQLEQGLLNATLSVSEQKKCLSRMLSANFFGVTGACLLCRTMCRRLPSSSLRLPASATPVSRQSALQLLSEPPRTTVPQWPKHLPRFASLLDGLCPRFQCKCCPCYQSNRPSADPDITFMCVHHAFQFRMHLGAGSATSPEESCIETVTRSGCCCLRGAQCPGNRLKCHEYECWQLDFQPRTCRAAHLSSAQSNPVPEPARRSTSTCCPCEQITAPASPTPVLATRVLFGSTFQGLELNAPTLP